MKSHVEVSRYGNILVLEVANAPVNAVNGEVRAGLLDGMRAAKVEAAIEIVVITGRGKNFIAGADLAEFDGSIAAPPYAEVLKAIEESPKPVVCVLHGSTLGAGVEIALAAHYRIALDGSSIGFPEITLGIVPGAGGTQRLPRLIGAEAALELLIGGTAISASRAEALGLVDKLASGDTLAAGLEFANALLAEGVKPRPVRDMSRTADALSDEAVERVIAANARSLRGRKTHHDLVSTVRAAVELSFDDGLAIEKALSDASLKSRESQALRHMFFAERASSKVPGLVATGNGMKIQKVAVVGAGTMGSGIAIAFNDAGFEVTLVDVSESGLERGRAFIRSNYETNVKRGRMTPVESEAARERIAYRLTIADAADADLVVEAVFEDLELKKKVLADVSRQLGPAAIVATNTSSLSVTALASATDRPDRVIGLHFFSPAHVMKLLEIVRGEETSTETLLAGLDVARRIRKIPAVSGDGFGFIGNRMMLDGAFREGEQMMLEGAGVDQIDNAIETFGFAMGQSRVNDMAGVDIGTLVRKQLALRETRPDPYCVVSDALTPLGRIGQKSGKGFYDYTVNPRVGAVDPEVTALIETLVAARDIRRRTFEDAEIVERFIFQLINVGADILKEGIAYRAADIDVVWVHGFGFPRHLGGPMFHADTLGLRFVADRVVELHRSHGHYWKPSELLLELAERGSTFAEYDHAHADGA